MNTTTYYLKETATGIISELKAIKVGDKFVSYSTVFFDVVDGELVVKAGYTEATKEEYDQYLSDQDSAYEDYLAEGEALRAARTQAVQNAYTAGEFGTMTPATIQMLYGITVS